MKRLCFGIVVLLVMMLSSVAYAETNIQIGDYLQMGTYYDEPILWRCVAFEKISGYDKSGNPITDSTDTVTEYQEGYLPLMLSDKVICIKPFDAVEQEKSGSHVRRVGYNMPCVGSNYWSDSNMRSWLNSSATAGNVTWLCGNPPTSEYVYLGYNSYANEAGFLTNFSKLDLKAIKEVTQKNLVSEFEYNNGIYTTGTSGHIHNFDIENVVQNYSTAYAEYATDKLFLLDVQQLHTVYNNKNTLGENYYIGEPTEQCIANADEDSVSLYDGKLSYLLRTYSSYSYYNLYDYDMLMRCVWGEGVIGCVDPNKSCGVRPAFYLNLLSIESVKGNGTEELPYCFDKQYIYKFVDDDGTVIKETTADYMSVIEPPEENPVKLPTSQYTFSKWDGYKEGMRLTDNITFKAVYSQPIIQIGDYLQMGTYWEEPILWRCVAFEKISGYDNGVPIMDSTNTVTEYKDGYLPLMISDKILCKKAFDAAGSFTDNSPFHHTSSHDRGYADRKLDASGNRYYWAMDRHKNGSNYWGDSNIRAWLNSTALNVTYPCVVYPSYSSEAGFLSNFTLLERKSIKTIQQKSFLDGYEYSTTTPNENAYGCGSSIENVVGNYSTDFYELVESSVFLIDTKQLHTIYKNRGVLGEDYYIGEPTEKFIEAYSPSLSDNKYSYLLRTPAKIYYQSSGVDVMRKYGDIVFTTAGSTSDSGIRPAFYLPNGSTKYMSGTGEKESPYVVEQTYTYKFVDDDGTVLKEEVDISGSEIIPPEVAPSKASNERYSYTFENWNGYTEGMRLTEDVIFKANYTTEVNQYTYKFLNDDGTVIKEATEDYGVTIEPPKETPIKTDDVIYKYHTFRGWKNYTQDMILTEDITFIAEYDKMNTEQATVIGDYENKLFVEYGVIDNNAVFTIKALNENDLPKLQMFIAEYNGNGTLKNIKLGTDTIQEGSLFITGDLPHSDNYKIMIWDKNQMPVINTITQINIT